MPSNTLPSRQVNWAAVTRRAAEIADEYATLVTLRQLHYRLVAEPAWGYPNRRWAYGKLSMHTAAARRAGWFPRLVDHGRQVHRPWAYASVEDARRQLHEEYRRDRTKGQPVALYLGAEKDTLRALFLDWFDAYSLPVAVVRGYSSQTFVDQVADELAAEAARDDRPAVLLYVGDHDPTGLHIQEDFARRVGRFQAVERVAVTWEQRAALTASYAPVKVDDPRYRSYVEECRARGVEPAQVEVEALPPDQLQTLMAEAVAAYWDDDAYRAVLALEKADRRKLRPRRRRT